MLQTISPEVRALFGAAGVEGFFDDYFEQRHLLVRGGAQESYRTILDLPRVERILWEQRHHLREFIHVVADETTLGIPEQQPFHWVRREFNRGASVVLNGAHEYDERLAGFQRRLQNELRIPMTANAYLTPGSSRTFCPHFDTHDAFVVQLHGSKSWRIHERAFDAPLSHHKQSIDQSSLGPPVAEFELHPGDVLYIPRGVVHWATSNDEPSLHVTFGWYPARAVDVVQEFVALAADACPRLRRALDPRRLGTEGGVSLAQALRLVADLAEREGAGEAAVARWSDTVVARTTVLPDGGLLGVEHESELGIDDWVERHVGLPHRVSQGGGRARIAFGGYPSPFGGDRPASFAGPDFLSDALEFASDTLGPFQVAQLPGEMTDGSRVLLAQQLVEAGFLRRVLPPPARQPKVVAL